MLADYHIHTKMCGHAEGEMAEYVQQAQKVGLDEIGISDHIPMYFLPEEERDSEIAMAEAELPTYIQAVRDLQEQFYPFNIKLGIEADFSFEHQVELKEILSKHPFDYVIGSIHFLDKWGFDNPAYIKEWKNKDVDEVYEWYFGDIEKAVESGLFDILAHPDLVKKFGFRPRQDLNYIYERLAKRISEADLCVEVNTAGLRVPVNEIYPSPEFLKTCLRNKVSLTLGSDAHQPDLVGHEFPRIRKLLKDIGYNEISIFAGRKRRAVSL